MPRSRLRRLLAGAVSVFVLTDGLRAASADDPAPGAPPKPSPPKAGAAAEAAAADRGELALLKDRVGEWCRARQDLRIDCPTCGGRGAVAVGGRHLKECGACTGLGKTLSKDRFRKVRFDLFSPAWRAQPGSKDAAGAEYAAALRAVRTTRNVESWRIESARLVDDTHGAVTTIEDKAAVPSRWIHATDPATRKTTWWLWSESADGPWPEPDATPPAEGQPVPAGGDRPAPATPTPVRPALVEATRVAVVTALASAQLVHTVGGIEGDAAVLVIRLTREKVLAERSWRVATDPDVIAAARAAFSVPAVGGVRILACVRARDELGRVEQRPAMAYELGRATFSKLDFGGLRVPETIRLFSPAPVPMAPWRRVEEELEPAPITLAQDKAVADAFVVAGVPHRLRFAGHYEGDLVVRVLHAAAKDVEASEEAAPAAAVRIARAVFAGIPEWAGVRIEFVLPFRDRFGKVADHAHLVAGIGRGAFTRLHLDTLSDAEVYQHFEREQPALGDLVLWTK